MTMVNKQKLIDDMRAHVESWEAYHNGDKEHGRPPSWEREQISQRIWTLNDWIYRIQSGEYDYG